jgi:uncharacterized protein
VLVGPEVAGYAEYVLGEKTIVFTHTVVGEAWGGHGLGSRLAREALLNARERGLRVRPKCPFIRAYIDDHPEFSDLVADA